MRVGYNRNSDVLAYDVSELLQVPDHLVILVGDQYKRVMGWQEGVALADVDRVGQHVVWSNLVPSVQAHRQLYLAALPALLQQPATQTWDPLRYT